MTLAVNFRSTDITVRTYSRVGSGKVGSGRPRVGSGREISDC